MYYSQPQHFHLDTPQHILALPLGAGDMVHVTHGSIWLTLEGHSRDVWLKTDDRWTAPLGAKAWISAGGNAAFAISRPAAQQTRQVRRVRAGRTPAAIAAAFPLQEPVC